MKTTDIEALEKKINEVLKPERLDVKIIGGLLDESRFTMRVFGAYNGERYYTQGDYSLEFLIQLSNQSPDYSIVMMLKTDFECLAKHLQRSAEPSNVDLSHRASKKNNQ